jgi:hypothetical protein
MCHPLESVVVMATVQQKVFCVLWLTDLKSIMYVQQKFQFVHGGSGPSCTSIKKWDIHLRDIGSVINRKSPGHTVKTRNILDKYFYISHTSHFSQQADNCVFPTPQFMMYTNI